MSDLKVFYNGDSSYAALDVEDAIKLWEQTTGEKREDYPDEEWIERPLDEFVTVTFEDENDMRSAVPENAPVTHNEDSGYWFGEATWRAWADKTGRGLICSENW